MEKHILIVDDDAGLGFFLCESIARLDPEYRVEMACSGTEALDRIVARPFDLVVTDLAMPDMDGLEVIRYLRRIHPDARFVLMTAHGNERVEAKARRLGAFGYLAKPFRMTDFASLVQEALLTAERIAHVR